MVKEKGSKKASKKKEDSVVSLVFSTASESEHNSDDDELSDDENGLDTDLDGHVEGNSTDGTWGSDDDRTLMEKVKAISNANDKANFKTRLKQVNWKQIAFKKFSPKDCEDRFNSHLRRVRRYRTLNEIIDDIEVNIKKSRAAEGLSAYHVFVKEQLANAKSGIDFENLKQRYQKLSQAQKSMYESKAKQENANKNKATAPPKTANKLKTPFMLFVESKQPGCDHSTLREEYTSMSVDKKYEWIRAAVRLAPENTEKLLNKEEQRIFKGQINTPPTAYTLFVKETFSKFQNKNDKNSEIISHIAQLWKQLDASKKEKYVESAAALKIQAIKEQEDFKARHGLVALKGKRRKSVYVEQPPEVHSTDDDDTVKLVSPKQKKRKLASDTSETSDDVQPTKQITIQPKSPIKSPTKHSLIEQPASIEIDDTINKKKKKKKKLESLSESSEHIDKNDNEIAGGSAGVTSPKKKSKKEKKDKTIEPPGDRPPPSLFEYFAKHVHTGKPRKATKAFGKLSEEESRLMEIEYNEKIEAYMVQLKKYLASLSKEDAAAYINKVRDKEKNSAQ